MTFTFLVSNVMERWEGNGAYSKVPTKDEIGMKDDLLERVHGLDSMTWKGIRNNILDFQ